MGRVVITSVLLIVAAAATGSCGSSGGLVWEEYDHTYETVAARDGFVRGDLLFWAVGGGPVVGDIDGSVPGLGIRMIYSFETGGISNDAEIQSAELVVFQESLSGAPGSGAQGALLVDFVDIGPALDGADWNGGTVSSNIGTLSSDVVLEWKSLNVTAAVQASVSAGRTYTDFRLHFATDSNTNGVSDYLRMNDGADFQASGHIPHLIIRYRAPRL